MTREEYIALPGLNWSRAKAGLRSAAHLKAALDDDEEREPTEAQIVGTLAHSMILEGKNLLDMFAIKPEGMSFATKDGKAWKAAQTLPILKEESAATIPRMAEAIAAHPVASAILRLCPDREHCVTATIQGVLMKCLLDGSGPRLILDVKTCEDASPAAFAKTCANFNYSAQMAIYQDVKALAEGLESPPKHAIIAVEKRPPHIVMVYELDGEAMEKGRLQYTHCLGLYATGQASGSWPGYRDSSAAYMLSLPRWASQFEPETTIK